jgi:hypothetical protein
MKKLLDILSKETKLRIAIAHSIRFGNMLNSNRSGIRVGECAKYKDIWDQAIIDITNNHELLEESKQEFYDYITSGEEDLLSPEEIIAVRKIYD